MKSYTPVLAHVYDRLEHFKKCIESLSNCPEAKLTELYISSDFYKNQNDKENVLAVRNYNKKSDINNQEVRNYIDSIIGFKKIHEQVFFLFFLQVFQDI